MNGRTWRGVGWVLGLGALGVAGLVGMTAWHRRAAHTLAAVSVAERGQWAARRVGLEAARAAGGEGGGWEGLSRTLASLQAVEGALEYVEVKAGETTLFVEDAESWGGGEEAAVEGEVGMGRAVVGGRGPVVTFAVTARGAGGEALRVELGLRRDAVEKEEWGAMRAVDSMYRLCAAGWVAMVLLGAAGVAWMASREEKRERARRMAEHLAFSGVLANGIVHDFRNPMSSLRLDAQLLEQEAGRGEEARLEKIREWSGRLKGTLDRMEGVFREFLALAKPGEGGGGTGRVDLLACAEECAEMLKPRFEASGVAVATEGERGTAVARANDAWLKRATLNILANAQQHAKGTVRVRASREGGKARLEVEDDGPGIPAADREKVFEMFHTTRPQGTGLGLYLARLAAEKCGGRIWAEEGRGGGARLVMEFAAENEGGEA